jgi:hypothetical protein
MSERSRRPAWLLLLLTVLSLTAAGVLGLTQVVAISPPPVLAAATESPAPVPTETPVMPPPTEEPQEPATCLQGLPAWFYTYAEGKDRPHDFGPSADIGKMGSVAVELRRRLCGDDFTGGDRRLAAALDAMLSKADPNRALSRTQWEGSVDRVVDFLGNQGTMLSVQTWTPPRGSMTMYMVGTSHHGDPVVKFWPAPSVPSKYLIMTRNVPRSSPGSRQHIVSVTLRLRLACGYQPVGLDVAALQAQLAHKASSR